MFDLPSYEIRLSVADDAIGADHRLLVDRSLDPSDGCASDGGIDLTDDAAVGRVVDDASEEYQIPRHQMMACEMSER